MDAHDLREASPPPRFSIVIATYNAASTLDAAIASVVGQGRDDAELLVIDGGSSDATMEIVRAYGSAISHAVSEPDKGIYDAWNKGVRAATGDYVGFVGADDILLPGALDEYARCIAKNPGAEYVSSRVRYGEGPGARIIGQPWSWARFRHWMTVAHVGSLHRRSMYERIGLYDDSFGITGDYEWLLRAGPQLRTAFTPAVTAQMGTGGISSGQDTKVFQETARAKARHSGLSAGRIAIDTAVARAKRRVRSLHFGGR